MAYDVRFLKGTSASFEAQKTAGQLDKNTFYYIDEKHLYLGEILLSNDDDVKAAVDRIRANEQAIADIKAELDELVDPGGTGGGSISSQLAALREELEGRIDDNADAIKAEKERAEAAEGTLQSNINTVSGTVDSLLADVEAHGTAIETLTTNLDNLDNKVTGYNNRITENTDNITDLQTNFGTLSTTVGEHTTQLTTLIGTDTSLSVRAIAIDELTKQLIPESAEEAMDTLQELAAWLQQHPTDAAEMNKNISANATAIENLQTAETTQNASIQALQEAVQAINNADTGILAQAKGYTDTEVEKLNGLITNLGTSVSANTSAIAAINHVDTGILAQAQNKIDLAFQNLGTAAYKAIEDFDAAGSAAAALNEAKEYTNTALTWGILTETQE